MPYKQLPFLALIFIVSLSFSQHAGGPTETTDVFKVTLPNPGISFEKSTLRKQTLYAGLYMKLSTELEPEDEGYQANFFFDPAFTLQYRFYYNAKKRADNDKRTAMNSSNYLAVIYECVLTKKRFNTHQLLENNNQIAAETRRPIHAAGIAWGLQRNFKNRFSLDVQMGVDYEFGKATTISNYYDVKKEQYGKFGLLLQLNIGLWLNKQQDG